MSKLDDILTDATKAISIGIVTGTFHAAETKQQIKDLILTLTDEVSSEQLHVEGSVDGNQLISEGFYKFKSALRQKVNEL